MNKRWFTSCAGAALALAVALSSTAVVGQPAVGTGAFPKVSSIDKQLKRGISTKSDVQKLLGVPNGAGGALLPGFGQRRETLDAYQIWFYQDVELTDAKAKQDVVQMNMRQQILGVFFKGEVFHGYFWTSTEGPTTFAQ